MLKDCRHITSSIYPYTHAGRYMYMHVLILLYRSSYRYIARIPMCRDTNEQTVLVPADGIVNSYMYRFMYMYMYY